MGKVILERHKPTDYYVNFEGRKYVWAGSKGKMISKREVPVELYDYLAMFTTSFRDGELKLVEKGELEKELIENLNEKEEYTVNTLTKEEATVLLKGNLKKMESELKKITSESTKQFVLSVAKEIKISNANKQKFIRDWIGSTLQIEDLFAENVE